MGFDDTILASANILPHVIKQYMLSYDSVCLSDHRALYIDIHLHKFIDMNIRIQQYIPRGITSTNPRIIRKYKEIVYDAMMQPDIKEKITHLMRRLTENRITEDGS